MFGSSTFGSTNTGGGFGSSNTGGFGSSTTGGFGTPSNSGGGGFGSSGFGSTNTNTGGFGNTNLSSSPFGGNNTNTSAFGATANSNAGGGFGSTTSTFGSTNTTSGGFGNSGFGSNNNTGGGFGATNNTSGGFGTNNNTGGGFGSTTTNNAFGGGGLNFGSGNTATAVGTAGVPFTPTRIDNGTETYVSISAMPQYKHKSFEELRLEDYAQNNKGGGGAPNTNTGNAFGATNNNNAFGQPQTNANSGGLFGNTNNTGNAFGATNNNNNAFGQNNNTNTGGGLFGNNNTASSPFGQTNTNTNNAFGSTNNNNNAFGSNNQSQGSSLFGASNQQQQQQQGGSLFGNNTNTGTGGGGLFGNNNNNNNSNAFGNTSSGGGLFGNNNNNNNNTFGNTAGGGGLFGNSNNNNQQNNSNAGGGLFGGNTSNSNTGVGGGLFGTQNNNNNAFGSSPGTTAFGSNTGQQQGSSLFGNNNSGGNTGGGLFGSQNNNNNNTFGNTNTNTGGLFGSSPNTNTNTNTGGGGLFGSSPNTNTNTNTGGGLFGNNNNTSGSLFGGTGTQNNTSGGGLFGNSNTNTSTSLFGNTNTGAQNNSSSLFGNTNNTANNNNNQLSNNPIQMGQSNASQINANPYAHGPQSQMERHVALAKQAWHPKDNPDPLNSSSVDTPTGRKLSSSNNSSVSSPFTISRALTPSSIVGVRPRGYGRSYGALVTASTPHGNGGGMDGGDRVSKIARGTSNRKSHFKGIERDLSNSQVLSPGVFDLSKRLTINKSNRVPTPRIKDTQEKKILDNANDEPQGEAKSRETEELIGETPVKQIHNTKATSSAAKKQGMSGRVSEVPVEQKNADEESEYPQSQSTVIDLALLKPSSTAIVSKPISTRCPVIGKDYLSLGYSTSPNIQELEKMTEEQLAAVQDFAISRENFGTVRWIGSVDVRDLVVNDVVEISQQSIEVYKSEEETPARGTKLNRPAICTVQNVDKPPEFSGSHAEFKEWLRDVYTTDIGGVFIDYTNGVWMFKVEHFTKYSFMASYVPTTQSKTLVAQENDHGLNKVNIHVNSRPERENNGMVDIQMDSVPTMTPASTSTEEKSFSPTTPANPVPYSSSSFFATPVTTQPVWGNFGPMEEKQLIMATTSKKSVISPESLDLSIADSPGRENELNKFDISYENGKVGDLLRDTVGQCSISDTIHINMNINIKSEPKKYINIYSK